MRNETAALFDAYTQRQAQLSGVASVGRHFNVSPSVQQKLETRMQESSSFLKSISVLPVTPQKGDKVGLSLTRPVASRTDTDANGPRKTKDPTGKDKSGYECRQIDSDTHIKYAMLDAWAHFPDFQVRISNLIAERNALDRIMVGWNGVKAEATTNLTTNPLLQDLTKGWLQRLREEAPQRVMSSGKVAGKVTVGPGGDYKNLDALAMDAKHSLIDAWHRKSAALRAICSDDLMHDKLFPIVNNNDLPSERLAADMVVSQMRLGGTQAVTVPFFIDGGLLITPLENLSIYWQRDARRKAIIDNPAMNQVDFFNSSNDDYVIEDFGACAFVENIEFIE
ncbi:phage major capsid protein, P2 family [Delftia lacustris]|uniref:phage major capsid protein, P2 family n=1 Tax=Delftia TaxID=80865 RepID=UPI002D76A52D|nr:phage major capsid protein, P2 family [Delftia lacustris]